MTLSATTTEQMDFTSNPYWVLDHLSDQLLETLVNSFQGEAQRVGVETEEGKVWAAKATALIEQLEWRAFNS